MLSKQQIEDTFKLFDADGSGAIDRDELFLALRSLGVSADKHEVELMMRKIDKDANGVVGLEEFEKMVEANQAAAGSEAEIRKAFELFTKNERTLTAEHCIRVREDLGMPEDDARCKLFIDEASEGVGFAKISDWVEVHTGKREKALPQAAAPAPAAVEEEDDEY